MSKIFLCEIDGDSMTKNEYMQRLFNALAPLPKNKRDKIMKDYEEQFADDLAQGKSEKEIIFELGSPEGAAQYFININKEDHGYNDNFKVDSSVLKNSGNTAHSWETAVWCTCSIFIAPILIALTIVFFTIGIALVVAGIASSIMCFLIDWLSTGFILLAIAGIFVSLLGVFVSILAIYDGARIIKKYFKFVGRRIRYGGKAV